MSINHKQFDDYEPKEPEHSSTRIAIVSVAMVGVAMASLFLVNG